MKANSRGTRSARAMLCVLFVGGAALAGDLDFRVSTGIGTTDNIRRTATNETDETIATADLRFAYDQHTAKLDTDLVGDVAYNDYLDNTYDSEVIGNVFANAVYAFVPERFQWSGLEQFGQVLVDPFQPATAANRENINYLATGPDFFIGLGSQTRLRLGGRYSMTDYERSPFDSANTTGELSVIRAISDQRSLSFNANASQTEYDDSALNADFDQRAAFVRYEARGARTNVHIDAGYNQLYRDATDHTDSGALVSVDVSRRVSGAATFTFAAGRQFTTAAGDFTRQQGFQNSGLTTTSGTQSVDPFTDDHASLGWNYYRNRTGVNLQASWSKRTYDNQALDQSMQSFTAGVRRDMSPRASLRVSASYMSSDFQAPSPSYDELDGNLTFEWRLSQSVTLRATFDHFDRTSDLAATAYTENRIFLTIGWGRGDPRSGRASPSFGVDSMVGPAR